MSQLETNTIALQSILAQVNALPDAGSGGAAQAVVLNIKKPLHSHTPSILSAALRWKRVLCRLAMHCRYTPLHIPSWIRAGMWHTHTLYRVRIRKRSPAYAILPWQ